MPGLDTNLFGTKNFLGLALLLLENWALGPG